MATYRKAQQPKKASSHPGTEKEWSKEAEDGKRNPVKTSAYEKKKPEIQYDNVKKKSEIKKAYEKRKQAKGSTHDNNKTKTESGFVKKNPAKVFTAEKANYKKSESGPDGKKNILPDKENNICPVWKKCGGCDYQGLPYEEQLRKKNHLVHRYLEGLGGQIHPIIGMDNPLHYRCKVHAAFDHDRKGNVISGIYEKNTHKLVPADSCMIEDEKSNAIIVTIRGLLRSFRIRTYDEDSGYGLLRHVMVRRGYFTGQYMVILVTADPIFPSKNNFVKALRKVHPEISTVILNINAQKTSMVLGERNIVLYGPGYIEDEMCGLRFRISPNSFYQVNPQQTRVLYKKAIEYAGLKDTDVVLDAYCGTGTIGLIAASGAGQVIGIEQNRDAVHDALVNARRNQIKNIHFINADATEYMEEAAGQKVNVIIMDPPRTGSTERFIKAAAGMQPERIVYVSCNPETLARDLRLFRKNKYSIEQIQPYDLFPYTLHVETVVLMSKNS